MSSACDYAVADALNQAMAQDQNVQDLQNAINNAEILLESNGQWNNPANAGSNQPIDQKMGESVADKAEEVAADYKARGVKYARGGDASGGGTTADCSHYVNDVLRQAGINAPYVTTATIASSPGFVQVTADDVRAGDVIVQGDHMGIYSGEDDAKGHPLGYQMGVKSGASEATWGPGGRWFPDATPTYYRPINR